MSRAVLLLGALSRRAAAGLLLLVGASFVIYLTVRLAPGDVVDVITPLGTPEEVKAQLMREFGLDTGPVIGYLRWLANSVQGNYGESIAVSTGEGVMALALPAYGRTLLLAGISLAVCLIFAVIGAILLGRPSGRQQWLTSTLYFVTAAPSFVVAIFFSQGVNELVHRYVDGGGYETPPWYPIPIYSESLMPYFFAGFVLIVGDALFMDFLNAVRSELQSLRGAQFITAVKAKGARTAGHIARNLVVPLVSGYAARLPIVLGGVVIVEYVFTLEGAGYLLLEAARERDFPVVVGLSVLFTATIIVVNVIADVLRTLFDPREAARGG